jgi:methylenetetrahydrofolate reductase (NADPH)
MKIVTMLKTGTPTLSYEVFPPTCATANERIMAAARAIAGLQPDFMSVTCSPAGPASNTAAVASEIQNGYGIPAIAHLTCSGLDEAGLRAQIALLRDRGIENVLALRGDIQKGREGESDSWRFRHAVELVRILKSETGFCVGAACYPEAHPESACMREDLDYLKEKVAAGCDFLATQMFFDNNLFYSYVCKLREAGIDVPVVAGIMPVTNAKSVVRIAKISGTQFTPRFRAIIDKFGDSPEAMKQAGIAYATDQIIDLYANGVSAVHVYTMNKPDVAAKIRENLSEIVPIVRIAG